MILSRFEQVSKSLAKIRERVPWQEFVDDTVVVVVVPDTVEALHVDLDGPPEEAGVDAGIGQVWMVTNTQFYITRNVLVEIPGVGPDGPVSQVVDGGKLVVQLG